MSQWKITSSSGGDTTYTRAVDGLDRIRAYVSFSQWEDEERPTHYSWSVQDGSCGKVLQRGTVDGDEGLPAAQKAADAAVAQLFPNH